MENIIGKKYNRLLVIGYDEQTKKYICKCDCGNKHLVNKHNLTYGLIKSCGCLFKEGNNFKHGDKNKRLYHIWKSMRQRCTNPNCINYKNYGGRGISVCSEWDDYINFREWSLCNGYNDTLTIDRIDVNGNYCPQNCRWVTYRENSRNMRTNRVISYNGETMILTEWAEKVGISVGTLWYRINKGWDIEKALTTPVKNTKSFK